MEIGTKNWHESLTDCIAEVGALAGFLGIIGVLVIMFTLVHYLHPR